MVVDQPWPECDESKCKANEIEIAVQVNGKIKTKLMIPAEAEQAEVIALAKADENVKKSVEGMNIIKEIYVKGRLVNIVVKP